MNDVYVQKINFPEARLWSKMSKARDINSFTLELTRRCNNNCRHCYINLPAGDEAAAEKELDLASLQRIAEEAGSLGALWCLLTGGEPLLRPDFEAVYLMLKKEGFLISVYTNACLVNESHIALWKKYPPRDIEVSVYGVTAKTYESVTRVPGSFKAFMRGVDLLLSHGLKVRFKAMAIRSTLNEMAQIADFCRKKTMDYFRFDPGLHLRFDGDVLKNADILTERLTPEEVVMLEASDAQRSAALSKTCHDLIDYSRQDNCHDYLFGCGAGLGSFVVSAEGRLRLCESLVHPECECDLKTQSVKEALELLLPWVRGMRSQHQDFLTRCRVCPIINLCLWCPARAHLETGRLDAPFEYACSLAHARAAALTQRMDSGTSGGF